MIRWLKPLFLLLGLILVGVASAHENTPLEIPPVTQRCVSIENNPPDDWTFEGTIITYEEKGIHGFRADMSTGYYIAFDGHKQFVASGTFSPDGQWFISFWGKTNSVTTISNEYKVSHLVVTSTHPRREIYLIPFQDSDSLSSFPSFWRPVWLDNTRFVTASGYNNDTWSLVAPFEGTIQNISEEEGKALTETVNPAESAIDLFRDYHYKSIPDNPPRTFLFRRYPNTRLYITDNKTNQIYDTCLKVSWGYTVSPTGDQVAAPMGGVEGFVYVIDLNDWTAYRLDLPANPVIAWAIDP